jgi:hypothetical protein
MKICQFFYCSCNIQLRSCCGVIGRSSKPGKPPTHANQSPCRSLTELFATEYEPLATEYLNMNTYHKNMNTYLNMKFMALSQHVQFIPNTSTAQATPVTVHTLSQGLPVAHFILFRTIECAGVLKHDSACSCSSAVLNVHRM